MLREAVKSPFQKKQLTVLQERLKRETRLKQSRLTEIFSEKAARKSSKCLNTESVGRRVEGFI